MDGPSIASGGLVRRLSLWHAVLYGVGVTIGAGIYVLVGLAAARSGMYAPLGFLAAAVAMGFTAASFAELGTRMPVSASEAAYVQAAFNRRFLSSVMGLVVVGTAIVSAATISAGSVSYIGVLVPLPGWLLIATVVLLMGIVAGLATNISISVAGAMTLVEVGGLLLIVLAGASDGGAVQRLPEMLPPIGAMDPWLSLGGTMLIAVFAFVGFEHIVNIAEEMKEPSRTLPRALFITIGLTTLLYMLVVWISVTAVAPQELARSPAPLATVFQRLTGLPLMTMSLIAIVATMNGIVVHMILIGRVLYGMAVQGNLPRLLGHVHPVTRTPLIATAAGVGAILLLTLAVPLEGLADLASRGTLAVFAGVNLSLIVIKHREHSRPPHIFVCPLWAAYAGLISSVLIFLFSWMT